MSAALAGLKVLDFTKFLPGPYCTWMLGDLGAEIVRLENARELEKQAKVFGWDKLSAEDRAELRGRDSFARNKKSAMLDFSAPDSRAIVEELVRMSDVLVEDYRPGVMEKMGFGYEAMAGINPRLIYCSVSLCGHSGPYSEKPGHDPIALAVSGSLSRLGPNPDRPEFAGLPIADLLAGSNAVIGILAALQARTATGRGQHVDIAMSDAAMTLIAPALARNPDLSRLPPRGKVRIDCGLWKTRDGRFLCTTDMEPRYWERFCSTLGRPEFTPLQLATDRWPEMRAAIADIIATRDLSDWLDILGAAGTQFAPVLDIEEALADPHNRARGMAIETVLPGGKSVPQIGSPIRLSGTPTVEPVPAGLAGGDTDEILRKIGRIQNRL